MITQLLFIFALSNPAKSEALSKEQSVPVNSHTYKNVSLTNESQFNKALALYLNGKTEVSIGYEFTGSDGKIISAHIRVDIENDEYIIEGGMDKRSSLDSIQQAVFCISFDRKKGCSGCL